MSGKLLVVGTPIGNLGDMTPRAVQSLRECDFIAAEDTRVCVKLLNHFDIKKPMISYYEHNKFQRGEMICDRIQAGEVCAIVTDAGMPAISDPGEELVRQCAQRGIKVESVPGPSAVVTALALSGLPSARFTFEGFLSVSKKARREHLQEIKSECRTMIFYEAPHKLSATLTDLFEILGERNIAIVREMTKLHEEVIRTTLSQAVEQYTQTPLRGEIVLVIQGALKEQTEEKITIEDAAKMALILIEDGFSPSEAAKQIGKQTAHKKGDIYKMVLTIQSQQGEQ